MWARLSIVVGLVAGIGVAALILGGILALAPEPVPPATPPPSVAPVTPTPSVPLGTAEASVSAPPSVDVSADPSAAFVVGEPAPALVVPQVGGGTIDLADLGGEPIAPDVTASP